MTAHPPDHIEPPSGASHPARGWLLAADLFVLTLALGAAVVLVVTRSASGVLLTAVGAFVVTILTAWRHRRGR